MRKFLYETKPRRKRKKRSPGYLTAAREAYERAIEQRYGSHGAASAVKRISPTTGEIIEVIDHSNIVAPD